ncbi:putative Connector enhancer of kinase suppressor of ras 2 [Cocos nucifera]|uniref:Putative Connector enhancer of kinase suppressor of ras 2 n=1 Tax=Cocos nucifera TaxID=13894 RepID=A0A8K0IC31_COCNU|nr:putative Connector enhancer of kinase suppressor of ras 2 [Cocos nucifera]
MLTEKNDSIFTAASVDSSYSMIDHDPVEEDDDWVVVKKQRITILIPPPSPEQPQMEIPESNHTQTKSRRNVRRSSNIQKKRCQKPSKDGPKKPAVIPFENKVSVDDQPKKAAVTPSEKRNQSACIRTKPRTVHNLIAPLENRPLVNGSGHISGKPLLQQLSLVHFPDGNVAVPNNTRIIRRSGTIGGAPRLPVGALKVVNQRMRASNLERELKGFGGLRNWLVSQGLDRFITIFEREKLGVYQLVNLTMSELKDMGADAVGPRRKLIHALDRLCQPYYFKALQ